MKLIYEGNTSNDQVEPRFCEKWPQIKANQYLEMRA